MPDTKIGTVELLAVRIYPLDPANRNPDRTEVIVQPGGYDLYSDHGVYYWVMSGTINTRGIHKIGDGMFSMITSDVPGEVTVTFLSERFGSEQFADFLAEPVCTEGHPDQRLRITVRESVNT